MFSNRKQFSAGTRSAGNLAFKAAMQDLRSKLDYTAYGGALLLGVNHLVLFRMVVAPITSRFTRRCALRSRSLRSNVVDAIRTTMERHNSEKKNDG